MRTKGWRTLADFKGKAVTQVEDWGNLDLNYKVVARIKRWIVMEAPTGHRFCVVNPQSDVFQRRAKGWE